MTMLEKVARAICARDLPPDDTTQDGTPYWRLYEDDARSAIDVVRHHLADVLLEHEPLAGPYIHDIIRAVDAELSAEPSA